VPVWVLVLLLLSAVLGPQPVGLSLLAVTLIGTGWFYRILCIRNINNVESTLIVFMDGRIRLGAVEQNMVGGFMTGQPWCTQRLTVLRVAAAGKVQTLLILPRQQGAEEYRRLQVWLRQGALQFK